ncbi:MAG: hypothetical protein H6672_19075 [Anaerolineaceae bacterium]|nr:hypothetical protein [Anaerolineaceae bacterium]
MKKLLYFIMLVLFMMTAAHTSAQDDTEIKLGQRVRLPGGYEIYIPDTWENEYDDETGGYYLFSLDEDFLVFVLAPQQVSETVDIGEDATPASLMNDINIALYGFDISSSSVFNIQMGDYPAALIWYPIASEDYEGYTYVIQFDAESFAFVDAMAPTADIQALGPLLAAIVKSMQPIPTGTGETCFVSTDTARTANLRVGPGENRTSVAFLPTGEDFEVLARYVADNGSVWYQLDKELAAPKSSAAEIWVAQELVTETGDCESVGETAPPPLIPITSSGSSSGGGGNAITPPSGGGGWVAILSDEADTSCAGTPNFHVRTTEVFSTQAFSVSISIAGNTLYFDGIPFTRQSSGAYYGSIPLANGNAQLTLRVVNANQLTGQMVGNAVFDGQACSVTMGITIHR